MRNVVRAYVLDSVVDFCLLLGKLVIVLITGATSFMAFGGYIPDIQVTLICYNEYLVNNYCFRMIFQPWITVGLQLCSLLLAVTSLPVPSSVSTPWPWTLCSYVSWRTWRGTTGPQRGPTTCPRAWSRSWGRWRSRWLSHEPHIIDSLFVIVFHMFLAISFPCTLKLWYDYYYVVNST